MAELKIKDEPHLLKDSESKAIINTDSIKLKEYKNRKQKLRNKDERINNLEQKVDKILELLLKQSEN